jgi:oleate hydratase
VIPVKRPDDNAATYLVGGGIASLAAAVFLIRDGDVKGHTITILEESSRIGGSLDAAGNATDGYVMRGGRMIESKYLCTYDLFSSIPTLDGTKTVTQEIFDWNETMKTSSKSRLFRDGRRVDAPRFGLSEKDILNLERLAIEPEEFLGRTTISDQFAPGFFETDFWHMWCTTFAFQPWHSAVEFKRYLVRFTHMVSGFNTLTGIMRTVYNQYDSMVRPLHKWLEERGVKFMLNTTVTDLALLNDRAGFAVDKIVVQENGVLREHSCYRRRQSHRDCWVHDRRIESGFNGLGRRFTGERPMAVPGLFGRRSRPARRSSGILRTLPITLSNRSGCPLRPRFTTPRSSN